MAWHGGIGDGAFFPWESSANGDRAGRQARFELLTPPGSAVHVINDFGSSFSKLAAGLTSAAARYPGQRVLLILEPTTAALCALETRYRDVFARAAFLRSAQPSILVCRPRPIASAPWGTSSVMDEPAPT